jgi:hypothetical protein
LRQHRSKTLIALNGSTGNAPPYRFKENSTLISGCLGQVNVNISTETTLVKGRTPKVVSSGQGDKDCTIVSWCGTKVDLMLSASTFVLDFLIEIATAQFILILARHTPSEALEKRCLTACMLTVRMINVVEAAYLLCLISALGQFNRNESVPRRHWPPSRAATSTFGFVKMFRA